MSLSSYFSLTNAVNADRDGVSKVAAGLARYEKENRRIARTRDYLTWDSNGNIVNTPLL